MSEYWKRRFAYVVLIGKKERNGTLIDAAIFYRELWKFQRGIVLGLGGFTKLRIVDGLGETAVWGAESSSLVLVISDEAKKADALLAREGRRLSKTLHQDEIWITRLEIRLLEITG